MSKRDISLLHPREDNLFRRKKEDWIKIKGGVKVWNDIYVLEIKNGIVHCKYPHRRKMFLLPLEKFYSLVSENITHLVDDDNWRLYKNDENE